MDGRWPETEHWEFDVTTALHDDVKMGLANCPVTRSRVALSRDYEWSMAKDLAAAMAIATNGGMAIEVLWRY